MDLTGLVPLSWLAGAAAVWPVKAAWPWTAAGIAVAYVILLALVAVGSYAVTLVSLLAGAALGVVTPVLAFAAGFQPSRRES